MSSDRDVPSDAAARGSEPAGEPRSRGPAAGGDDRAPSGGASTTLGNLADALTVLVALAAIGLSIWQGYQNRRFYRLSVLPHLEPTEATLSSATTIENELFLLPSRAESLFAVGYSLQNTGLGPAVLENLLVYRGGERSFDAARSGERYVLSDVKADLDRLPFPTMVLNHGYAAGEMLETGEVHHLITVGVPFEGVDRDALDRWPPDDVVREDVLETYSFVFCYCSVYGTDCGAVHLGADPPVEDACGL